MTTTNILATAIVAFMLVYCVNLVRAHPTTTNWSAGAALSDDV
jgi:hypothetical protein